MEEVEELKLIRNEGCLDTLFVRFIKSIGYGLGSIPLWPHFICNGLKPNKYGYSSQSCSYNQNNETVYRSYEAKDKLVTDFQGVQTLNELLINSTKKYPERRCFGRRVYIKKSEETDPVTKKPLTKYAFGDYEWKTYSSIMHQVESISNKLLDIGVKKGDKIAIFANTSPEWTTMVLSLLNIDAVIVTVYSTLSDEAIDYAFSLTEIIGVMVDEQTLPRVKKMYKNLSALQFIITSTYVEPYNVFELTEFENVQLFDFNDIVSYCSDTDPYSRVPSDTNALAFIMFTSGSTGLPKGVMISHRNLLSIIAAFSIYDWISEHVYGSFLPASHIFELFLQLVHIAFGSCIGYCYLRCLFNTSPSLMVGFQGDIPSLNPTMIIAVPLLIERIKKGVNENLSKTSRMKQILFQTCYNIKMWYRHYGFNTPILDKLIFRKIQTVFGTRLRIVYIGGAHISPQSQEFANICFGNFKQGYGLTETCGAVLFTDFYYFRAGVAGKPTSNVDVKLLKWEEGNYDPNDQKHPSGEVAVSGDCITMGYYKNEQLTNEAYWIDETTGKRWFRTGDIATVQSDGSFKIIDRKKDIVKLLHGEYVSLIKIETAYSECLLVDMVCVCPTKRLDALVALIVVNRERSFNYLVQQNLIKCDDDIETQLEDSKIKKCLSDYISNYGITSLVRQEIPSTFHIVNEIWTPESNLLTPTAKLKRPEIAKFYAKLLDI